MEVEVNLTNYEITEHNTLFAALEIVDVLLVVCFNALGLLAISCTEGEIEENSKLFLQALFIADTLNGIILGFVHLYAFFNGYLGDLCDIGIFLCFGPPFGVFLLVCCVTIDRYLQIIKPLRYHILFTLNRARLLLVLVLFLVATTILLLPIESSPLYFLIYGTCHSYVLVYDNIGQFLLIFLFTLFLIPILVTTVINIHVFVIAIRQSRLGLAQNRIHDRNRQGDVLQHFADCRRFYMAFGITCMSYIGWFSIYYRLSID